MEDFLVVVSDLDFCFCLPVIHQLNFHHSSKNAVFYFFWLVTLFHQFNKICVKRFSLRVVDRKPKNDTRKKMVMRVRI